MCAICSPGTNAHTHTYLHIYTHTHSGTHRHASVLTAAHATSTYLCMYLTDTRTIYTRRDTYA